VGMVFGTQHRSEIFEGVDKIVRHREADGGIGSDHFPLFEKVGAAIWRSAQYLGLVEETVLP